METKKPYSQYTFEEIKEFITTNKISGREMLYRRYRELWQKANDMGWMDDLLPIKSLKKYIFKTIDDVIAFIDKNKIQGRGDCQSRFQAAYNEIKKVDGWEDVLPSKKSDSAQDMSEVDFVKYIEVNEIKSSTQLYNKSAGIHKCAKRNGWIEKYFPETSKFHHKDYDNWSLEDVQNLIKRENISDHREFHKKYQVLDGICHRKGWDILIFPEKSKRQYKNYTFEQFCNFITDNKIQSRTGLSKYYGLYIKAGEETIDGVKWIDKVFPESKRTKYIKYTTITDITAFVKEFLANWDEALHYPNVILMKLAESFGDTSILNKLVKKIATTDPGSIERKELLEEMQDKMVDNEGITCKEIEQIIKMSQGMEDNATDDPVSAMERLMNMEDVEDDNGDINAETLGRQVDMAQRALNNKLLDNKNCGDIVLTIKNVFLHRMLCLWADGDDNVTEKMMDKLFVES